MPLIRESKELAVCQRFPLILLLMLDLATISSEYSSGFLGHSKSKVKVRLTANLNEHLRFGSL